MKKNQQNTTLQSSAPKIRSGVKAGATINHNQTAVRIRSAVKAGAGLNGSTNHNETLLGSRSS